MERDRYLDFLRAVAIVVVALGHWLLAVVWLEDGALRATSLTGSPAAAWLVLVVQIMPVFFMVGGLVNARSWRSAAERGEGYGAWLRGKALRLVRPAVPLVAFWLVLAPAVTAAGLDRELVDLGMTNALIPLWFLVVYPLVIALVPVLLALHARLGVALPVGLTAVAAGLDAVGGPAAWPNLVLVWAVPLSLGFCWGAGQLDGLLGRVVLPVGGAAVLAVAVAGGLYVLPEDLVTRLEAPAAALALLGLAQSGVVLAVAPPVRRWLERPRVWRGVVGLNSVAVTVYLWHMTVMLLVVAALYALGVFPSVAPLSPAWWLTRPLWWLGLAAVLAPAVLALSRFERGRLPSGPIPTLVAIPAVLALSAAVAVIVETGATLLPVTALALAVTLLTAWPARGRAGATRLRGSGDGADVASGG